jgi:hypothetical protein
MLSLMRDALAARQHDKPRSASRALRLATTYAGPLASFDPAVIAEAGGVVNLSPAPRLTVAEAYTRLCQRMPGASFATVFLGWNPRRRISKEV